MATKPKPADPLANVQKQKLDKPWQGAPRGYVNADINKEEKADFLQWYDENVGQDCWDHLCAMLDDGYRVTVSEGDKGFKASATNVEASMESRGLCLSGYGSDAQKALASLLYKHVVKLAGDWGTGESDGDTFFR